MQSKFILLVAMCAFATALPRDRTSAESDSSSSSSESDERKSPEATTTATVEQGSNIITIENASDLETRVSQAGDDVVIIFLMVTWCPYCQKVNPIIEDIAATTKCLTVLKVNRDHIQDNKAWKYGLNEDPLPHVPTFIFIKNGIKVNQLTGSDSDIRGTLAKIMNPKNSSSSESSDSSDEQ